MVNPKCNAETVKADFFMEGITITEWAIAHGFRREDVYSVLSGRTKGARGKAHFICVALGLKNPKGRLALKPELECNKEEVV